MTKSKGGKNMEEVVNVYINFGKVKELAYELWLTISEYAEKRAMSRMEIDLAIVTLIKVLYENDRRERGKKL
jgi:hypothetical protein